MSVTSLSSDSWNIIGGMSMPETIHGFVRAPLVVRRGDDMIIARVLEDDVVHGGTPRGERLEPEEWSRLIQAEEGFALRIVQPVFSHAALWILGTGFDFKPRARADLEKRGAHRAHEEHDGTWVVLVDESCTNGLRDTWAEGAFQAAWDQAEALDVGACVHNAVVASELMPRMVDTYLAMRCVAYELAGDKIAAEDLLKLVRNSRGSELHGQVLELKERFMRELRLAHAAGVHASTKDERTKRWRRSLQRAAIRDSLASLHRLPTKAA